MSESKPIFVLMTEDEHGSSLIYGRAVEISAKVFDGDVKIIHRGTMEESEQLLASEKFDAWILDLTLPDSTQGTTISRLPYLAACSPPIFIMTGDTRKVVRDQCIDGGAECFTVKGDAKEAFVTFFERLYNMVRRRERDIKLGRFK